LSIPPADYYGIAWANESTLALVSSATGSAPPPMTLVPVDGSTVTVHTLAAMTCQIRDLDGLSALPDGTIGFVDVCDTGGASAPGGDLVTLALPAWQTQAADHVSQEPMQIAWRADSGSAVVQVGGSLCETLYDSRTDRPVAATVLLNFRATSIGEDLAADSGHCTQSGRVAYPAFAPSGDRLAFVAASVSGAAGRDRIETSWSLFVLDDQGKATLVLTDIYYPRGLGWLDASTLVFTRNINAAGGLWTVRIDGSNLTRLSQQALDWLAVSPGRTTVAGIPALPVGGGFSSNQVVLIKRP
jgi:hypothetical protein